jgi:hypothetical protein
MRRINPTETGAAYCTDMAAAAVPRLRWTSG